MLWVILIPSRLGIVYCYDNDGVNLFKIQMQSFNSNSILKLKYCMPTFFSLGSLAYLLKEKEKKKVTKKFNIDCESDSFFFLLEKDLLHLPLKCVKFK